MTCAATQSSCKRQDSGSNPLTGLQVGRLNRLCVQYFVDRIALAGLSTDNPTMVTEGDGALVQVPRGRRAGLRDASYRRLGCKSSYARVRKLYVLHAALVVLSLSRDGRRRVVWLYGEA